MDTMMISEREPSFTFTFPDTIEHDLPRCFTPEGDVMDLPQLMWECSNGFMSREQSFGLMMDASMSGEQGFGSIMELSEPAAAPAAQEALTSDIQDEEPLEAWIKELDELLSGGESILETCEAAPSEVAADVHDFSAHSICIPVGSKRRAPEEEEADEIGDEQEWQPIKKQATQKQAPQKEAAQKRGAHMKKRPEMQEQAREGQAHWGGKVVELRRQWEEERMWEHNEEFVEQVRMCKRTHVKSQHECLLRQLQMASVAGWIRAGPFSTSEGGSFLGWTGFEVVAEHGAAFRRSIEEMFANVPKDKTLNNALRRAGLVAKEGWGEAWRGLSSFHFVGDKRAHYASKK